MMSVRKAETVMYQPGLFSPQEVRDALIVLRAERLANNLAGAALATKQIDHDSLTSRRLAERIAKRRLDHDIQAAFGQESDELALSMNLDQAKSVIECPDEHSSETILKAIRITRDFEIAERIAARPQRLHLSEPVNKQAECYAMSMGTLGKAFADADKAELEAALYQPDDYQISHSEILSVFAAGILAMVIGYAVAGMVTDRAVANATYEVLK